MKIDDYPFKRLPQDVIDFKDQVTLLLNNGKYSNQVVATVPTWTARDGEAVFFLNTSGVKRWYFYLNSSWQAVQFTDEAVKGWIAFSGTGTTTILGSYNVESLTRISAGEFQVVWTTSFAGVIWPFTFGLRELGGGTPININCRDSANNPSASRIRIRVLDNSGIVQDPNYCSIIAIGSQ